MHRKTAVEGILRCDVVISETKSDGVTDGVTDGDTGMFGPMVVRRKSIVLGVAKDFTATGTSSGNHLIRSDRISSNPGFGLDDYISNPIKRFSSSD